MTEDNFSSIGFDPPLGLNTVGSAEYDSLLFICNLNVSVNPTSTDYVQATSECSLVLML
jgi:hypothetical protein